MGRDIFQKSEDPPQGNANHLENDGKPTYYPNMV